MGAKTLYAYTNARQTRITGYKYMLKNTTGFYVHIPYEIEETDDYVDCKFYMPYVRTRSNTGVVRSGSGSTPSGIIYTTLGASYIRFESGDAFNFSDSESTGVAFSIEIKNGRIELPRVATTQASSVYSESDLCDSQSEIIYTKRFYKTREARTETITIGTTHGTATAGSCTGTSRFDYDDTSVSASAVVTARTATISDSTITVDVPAKAGGATVRVKVDGAWEEGELKAKVDGEWVDAEAAYVKVNGAWIEIN